MKIRNEFVNNSSSSSFVIKGYKIAADNSGDERFNGCIKRYEYGMHAVMVEC